MKTEDGNLAVDLSHKILFQVVDGVASIVIKRWGKKGGGEGYTILQCNC